ncbi:hypothetical protein ABPG74_019777 [Tetrahymena malaccensis]
MGQKNSKKVIYFKNQLIGNGDFLQSNTVTDCRQIYLDLLDLDMAYIEKACMKLDQCYNLDHLSISLYYKNQFMYSIAKTLAKLQKLINLKIEFAIEDTSDIDYCSLCLLNQVRISESLILIFNLMKNFNSTECKSLYSQLSSIENLTDLQILKNGDYPYYFAELSQNLRKCQKLTKLTLGSIDQVRDLNTIGLLNQISNLQELHLQVKNITPQQTQQIVHQLNQFPKSCSLHLNLKQIKEELNLYEVIDEFRLCKTLTALNLSMCQNTEMPKLGLHLGQIENLQSLMIFCLGQSKIVCTEGELLSGIQHCKNLKHLTVSFGFEQFYYNPKNPQSFGLMGCKNLNTLKFVINHQNIYIKLGLQRVFRNLKKLKKLVNIQLVID